MLSSLSWSIHNPKTFSLSPGLTDSHASQQLTWTVLPQGFQDSPYLFGQAVPRDLLTLHLSTSKLFQYVDDLLLCSPSLYDSQQHTALLLNFLGKKGYHVSPNRAQLSLTQVTYLGLSLSPTHKAITTDRKALIAALPVPTTKAKTLSFLGLAGYLRAWVPNFSLMAKPLYEASRGSTQEPLDPSQPVSDHFKPLLQALLQAPALCLSDLTHLFFLYVSERQGFALGVLGHNIGSSFAPVAYLSKQLDPITRGWAPCLRALEATSLLIQESKKLTFGSPLTVYSPDSL
jgi:hypothetical protein